MIVTHVHEPYAHSQYYLGTYEKGKSFAPEIHGQLSSVTQQCMAPETMLDDKGRRIFMAWHLPWKNFKSPSAWRSLATLPRVFSIAKNGQLDQRPVEELKKLRFNHRTNKAIRLNAGKEHRFANISGTCMELGLTIKSGSYETVGVKVLQAADGSEETIIGFDSKRKTLYVDFGKSTKGVSNKHNRFERWCLENHKELKQEYVTRQELPFELGDGEDLNLQIFIDQAVIEVFANNRQVLVQNVFPSDRKSNEVSVFTEEGDADISRIEAWDMHRTNAF